jgi:hypothetical protein
MCVGWGIRCFTMIRMGWGRGADAVELGEAVAPLLPFMNKEPLCKLKDEPENRGWQCRIGKPGSPGDLPVPTAQQLNSNMRAAGSFLPEDPPKIDGMWDLEKCTPSAFPYQSHHLIPKMHLPKHDVCVWLAKKGKNAQWELTESTNYDTDDARNGLALPFASNTYQWKHTSDPAKKDAICRRMMDLTKKQLHQGSHTYENYDCGEEEGLHGNEETGYLGAVNQLLKMVNGQVLLHVRICEECKKSDSTPRKVRPLERVVAAMYQASSIMASIITGNVRFVSERAARHLGSSVT